MRVVWSESAENKAVHYKGEHFSFEETRCFIAQLMIDVEEQLLNPFISKRYTEQLGEYKGISRIVIQKVRIYYEVVNDKIIILAIKFPGEK